MTDKDKVHGEGNYAASKGYNQATKKFAQSGKVSQAARAAAPKDKRDAADIERAEAIGKSRSKGEDPQLYESVEDEDFRDEDERDSAKRD